MRLPAHGDRQGRQTDQLRHPTEDDAARLADGDKHVCCEGRADTCLCFRTGISLIRAAWLPVSRKQQAARLLPRTRR
jgi:hypothetical protein